VASLALRRANVVEETRFTLIAVLTLALSIGANTAIFSVVNGVLLRPLLYKEPNRLVRVYSEFPMMNLRKFGISSSEFLDIQREAKSWESIGAWSAGGVNISSEGEPIRVNSTRVTRSLIEGSAYSRCSDATSRRRRRSRTGRTLPSSRMACGSAPSAAKPISSANPT
jgi:hypothetical protein